MKVSDQHRANQHLVDLMVNAIKSGDEQTASETHRSLLNRIIPLKK